MAAAVQAAYPARLHVVLFCRYAPPSAGCLLYQDAEVYRASRITLLA